MGFRSSEFPTTIALDMFGLICGKKIGRGVGRRVYEYGLDPSLVIKIEDGAGSFQNVLEWQVWERVSEVKGIAAWFAPCIAISPCGTVLVQKRTKPARPNEYYRRVPEFFTDLKRDNWGVMGKRLVCHDYGSHLLIEKGMTTRTRKADWWD